MATSKSKEIAKTNENAVSVFSNEAPEWMNKGTGRGSEEVDSKDIALPRLEIVQSQSPIKDDNEEAREGMLFNSATGELLGDTIYFVPCFYKTEYIVWKDKEEGGGFFGSFPSEYEAQKRRDEKVQEGENPAHLEIVDTPVHFGLMVNPSTGQTQQLVIAMAKSKAKVSRKWNATIQIVGGDRFSRVYKITTFKDKNNKNQTFHNFVVQPAGFVPENIYREAEQVYEIFRAGVAVNHGAVVGEADGSSATGSEGRGDI